MSKKSVFCIAASREQANQIVDRLKAAHFSNKDISALFADKHTSDDFARESSTKAPEGAVTGVGAGGIAEGLVGMGIPQVEAIHFEDKLKEGGILISVHTEDSLEIGSAMEIFTKGGGHHICVTGEASTPKESKAPEREENPVRGFAPSRP